MMLYRRKNSKRNWTKYYTDYLPKTTLIIKFDRHKCLEYFYALPNEIQNSKNTPLEMRLKIYLISTTIKLLIHMISSDSYVYQCLSIITLYIIYACIYSNCTNIMFCFYYLFTLCSWYVILGAILK